MCEYEACESVFLCVCVCVGAPGGQGPCRPRSLRALSRSHFTSLKVRATHPARAQDGGHGDRQRKVKLGGKGPELPMPCTRHPSWGLRKETLAQGRCLMPLHQGCRGRGCGAGGCWQSRPASPSRIPTGDPPRHPSPRMAEGQQGTPDLGDIRGSGKRPQLALLRLCQPAHARMCGFPPPARSNPPTLQQIIKTHLYLICLLELIEFLCSANATVCAASRSLARNS